MSGRSADNAKHHWALRAARYLYNDRKGRSWTVGFISVLAFQLTPFEPMKDILLAFLGVTITFIVLPDPKRDMDEAVIQHNLWAARPNELAKTLGSEAARSVAHQLVTATLPATPEGFERVLDDSVIADVDRQLMTLWDDPRSIVHNMRYELSLTYEADRLTSEETYRTRSVTYSERYLDLGDAPISASFCRTPAMFSAEFGRSNCLTRELIELTTVAWTEASKFVDEHFSAVIVIRPLDGPRRGEIRLDRPRFEVDGEAVRIIFDPPSELIGYQGRVWSYEEYIHPLPASIRCYPSIFSSYFTSGDVHLSLDLDDPRATKMTVLSFMSDVKGYTLSSDADVLPSRERRTLQAALAFRESLFWPGSGAVFYWECERDAE